MRPALQVFYYLITGKQIDPVRVLIFLDLVQLELDLPVEEAKERRDSLDVLLRQLLAVWLQDVHALLKVRKTLSILPLLQCQLA